MKRKSRNTLAKKKISLAVPFDLSTLGTENDPCFGKLHDSLADACRRCGDSEFCSIATAQNLKVTRAKLEKQNIYKDIEEIKIVEYSELKTWLKSELKNGKILITVLKEKAIKELEIGPFLFDKYIKRMIRKSKFIHLANDKESLLYKKPI